MRDNKGGFVLKIPVQVAYYFLFSTGVNRTQAIIKYDNLMITGKRPSNRDSLFLTTAECNTSFTDQGIVTAGKLSYLIVDACIFSCFFGFSRYPPICAEKNIRSNSITKRNTSCGT